MRNTATLQNDFDYTAHLRHQPSAILDLAGYSFPALHDHMHEWHKFLCQRGHELLRQLNEHGTESDCVKRMSNTLNFFTPAEYSAGFIAALKSSLYDIVIAYDDSHGGVQAMNTALSADKQNSNSHDSAPIAAKPLVKSIHPPLDFETKVANESAKQRDQMPGINFARTVDKRYTQAKNGLFALTTVVVYSFYGAAAVDIAVNGVEDSYTSKLIQNLTTSPARP